MFRIFRDQTADWLTLFIFSYITTVFFSCYNTVFVPQS